jgi:HD superfamily phosphohydrolase YqeK
MTWSEIEQHLLGRIGEALKEEYYPADVKDWVVCAGIAHDKAKDEKLHVMGSVG